MARHRWQKKIKRPHIDVSGPNNFREKPFNDSDAFGIANEDRAAQALQLLVEEGHIYGFYRTERNGELDKRGVDFQIDVSRWRIMNLQVKSSSISAQKHRMINGNLIPCVIVLPRMSIERIAEYIREEVERTTLEELRMAIVRARQNPN